MLEDLKPPIRQHACKVRTIAQQLEEKDREIFLEAVMSEAWQYKTLSDELAKRGIAVVDTTIKAHRIKACGCFRN